MKCKNCFYFFSFIILCVSILIYFSLESSFEEIELQNTRAKCIDGSNYKFLFSKGYGKGSSSFYFFFEPGGFCGDHTYSRTKYDTVIPNCYDKTKLNLGTNRITFIVKHMLTFITRMLSQSKLFNPNFYNWNKVFVRYCDGALYQGSLDEPIIYNNTKLYIRGEDNVVEMLKYLVNNYSFTTAENVLVTGSSAGGIAAFSWSKYINTLIQNKNVNYKVISDSGVFLDRNISLYDNRNVMKEMLQRLTTQLNLTSTERMKLFCPFTAQDELWKCFSLLNLIEYNIGNYPMLFLVSQYDSWAMNYLVGSKCYMYQFKVYDNCNATEIAQFERYSTYLIEDIKQQIATKEDNKVVLWMPKGFFHMFSWMSWTWNNKNYAVEGYTVNKIIDEFYHDNIKHNTILMDTQPKKYCIDVYWFTYYFNKLAIKLIY